MTLEEEVRELAKFAKAASVKLAQATTEERNGALLAMAAALRAQAPAIVEANGEDMEAARAAGTTEALLVQPDGEGMPHITLAAHSLDLKAGQRGAAGPAHAGRVPRLRHGRRFGGGGGAARSARRRVAGIDPLQRHRASARVGAPRRGGHGLRGPAQRDRRRCRGLREVRQRVHPAGRQPCGPLQRGHRRRAGRGCRGSGASAP